MSLTEPSARPSSSTGPWPGRGQQAACDSDAAQLRAAAGTAHGAAHGAMRYSGLHGEGGRRDFPDVDLSRLFAEDRPDPVVTLASSGAADPSLLDSDKISTVRAAAAGLLPRLVHQHMPPPPGAQRVPEAQQDAFDVSVERVGSCRDGLKAAETSAVKRPRPAGTLQGSRAWGW